MAHTQLQDGVAEENRTDNSLAQKRVVRIDLGNAIEKRGSRKICGLSMNPQMLFDMQKSKHHRNYDIFVFDTFHLAIQVEILLFNRHSPSRESYRSSCRCFAYRSTFFWLLVRCLGVQRRF